MRNVHFGLSAILCGFALLGSNLCFAQEQKLPELRDFTGDGLIDGVELQIFVDAARQAIANDPTPLKHTVPKEEYGSHEVSSREIEFINPTSKERLWGKFYYPSDASPQKKYPGFIWIPGGLGYGSIELKTGRYECYASHGYVVGCFDPDGRGKSLGAENWQGRIQQDGLHEFAKLMFALDFVEKDNIGVVSNSLGVALVSGMLARYPNDPPLKFFVDNEGPCLGEHMRARKGEKMLGPPLFGGHTAEDTEWWAERCAEDYAKGIVCRYQRIQGEIDHVQHEYKGHALHMINNATATQFGGNGKSPWTRINDNPTNKTYSETEPPAWIPSTGKEVCGPTFYDLLYVKEMVAMPPLSK